MTTQYIKRPVREGNGWKWSFLFAFFPFCLGSFVLTITASKARIGSFFVSDLSAYVGIVILLFAGVYVEWTLQVRHQKLIELLGFEPIRRFRTLYGFLIFGKDEIGIINSPHESVAMNRNEIFVLAYGEGPTKFAGDSFDGESDWRPPKYIEGPWVIVVTTSGETQYLSSHSYEETQKLYQYLLSWKENHVLPKKKLSVNVNFLVWILLLIAFTTLLFTNRRGGMNTVSFALWTFFITIAPVLSRTKYVGTQLLATRVNSMLSEPVAGEQLFYRPENRTFYFCDIESAFLPVTLEEIQSITVSDVKSSFWNADLTKPKEFGTVIALKFEIESDDVNKTVQIPLEHAKWVLAQLSTSAPEKLIIKTELNNQNSQAGDHSR